MIANASGSELAVPMFVTVTVVLALDVPTTVLLKLTANGDALSTGAATAAASIQISRKPPGSPARRTPSDAIEPGVILNDHSPP